MWVIRVFSGDRRKPIAGEDLGDLFPQGFRVRLGARHQQAPVVRVPAEPVVGQTLAAPLGPFIRAGPRALPVPWAMCSSRTERATLLSNGERIDPCGVPALVSASVPSSVRMPAFRNAFTKARTRLSPIRLPHPIHEGGMRNFVETGFDVALHDPLI